MNKFISAITIIAYTCTVLAYLRYRNFSSSRIIQVLFLRLCRINKIRLFLVKTHPNVSYLLLRRLLSMMKRKGKYLLRPIDTLPSLWTIFQKYSALSPSQNCHLIKIWLRILWRLST